MMKNNYRAIVAVFLVGLFLSNPLLGNPIDYWDIKIPSMKGAYNIQETRSINYANINLVFDIKIPDLENIITYYDVFFSSIGWERSRAKLLSEFPSQFPNEKLGLWDYSSLSATNEGKPEAVYATGWITSQYPVNGKVTVTFSDFVDDYFIATVEIDLNPEIEFDEIMDFTEELIGNAKDYFSLFKKLNGDPFDVTKLDLEKIKKLPKTDNFTKKYIEMVEHITNKMNQFRETYIIK